MKMKFVETALSAVLNILSIYIDFRIIDVFLERKTISKYYAFGVGTATWFINFFMCSSYDGSGRISLAGLLLF